MNLDNLTSYFGNDGTDAGLLLILVVIDTTLALTYRMGTDKKFISSKMLSGILRNAILSVIPLGIRALSFIEPRQDDLYKILSAFFFVFISWSIIVSILSYVSLLGIKYPAWLLKILGAEINAKGGNIDIEKLGENNDRNKEA